jgi:hypothetical protein
VSISYALNNRSQGGLSDGSEIAEILHGWNDAGVTSDGATAAITINHDLVNEDASVRSL